MRPLEVVTGGTTRTFFRGGPCAWLLSGLPVCPAPLVWLFPCCWFFWNIKRHPRLHQPHTGNTLKMLPLNLYSVDKKNTRINITYIFDPNVKLRGTHISDFLCLILWFLLCQELPLGVWDLAACKHTETNTPLILQGIGPHHSRHVIHLL